MKKDNISNFYDAWHYLYNHDMHYSPVDTKKCFSFFPSCLDIDVVKVNPVTNSIEDEPQLNTKTQVWLESGCEFDNDGNHIPTHDVRLDCGADDFEYAIIKLAKLVRKYYDKNDNEEKKAKYKVTRLDKLLIK